MNLAVREYLEKKLSLTRLRQQRIERNPNYDDLELGPECSKAFGFPDNSMMVDPDSAILNLQIGGSKRSVSTPNRQSHNNLPAADDVSNKTGQASDKTG